MTNGRPPTGFNTIRIQMKAVLTLLGSGLILHPRSEVNEICDS